MLCFSRWLRLKMSLQMLHAKDSSVGVLILTLPHNTIGQFQIEIYLLAKVH